MKPRILSIQEGIVTKLVALKVGRLRFQVPWTKLHVGAIECVVEDVRIVVSNAVQEFEGKANVDDTSDDIYNFQMV